MHDVTEAKLPTPGGRIAIQVRLMAITAAARFHGAELDRNDLRTPADDIPGPAALTDWLRDSGLWAKSVRLTWQQIIALDVRKPVVLLLNDGSAVLLVATDRKRDQVMIRHSRLAAGDPPVAVSPADLHAVWSGEAILMRANRTAASPDAPFSIGWVAELVWAQRKPMRDVLLASLVLSILTILPALMVMTVIDQVVTHQSLSTLALMSLLIAIAMLAETLLGYARRQLILIVGARVDAQLNLHVFQRLLRLPLDYFEHNQAGTIWSRTGLQISKIRDFLTGKLLTTMLDLVTLLVLLPILFYLQPTLSWMVLLAAAVIAGIIVACMQPMSRHVKRFMDAETAKSSVMVETLHGIRTVKSLALEPQQRDRWDASVAEATEAKIAAGRFANLPQTLINPIEGFMQRGVLLVGAYLTLTSPGTVGVGGLVAFMMLSARVAQPLAGLAKLMESLGEVRTATALAASVLNQRPETADPAAGVRPARHQLRHRPRHRPRRRRPQRLRQIHPDPPAARHHPRLPGPCQHRRHGFARHQPGAPAPQPRRRAAGKLPVPRHDFGKYPGRPPRPDAVQRRARRPPRRRRRVHRALTQRLCHHDRGRLAQPLRRPAPAPRHRPGAGARPAHPDPR